MTDFLDYPICSPMYANKYEVEMLRNDVMRLEDAAIQSGKIMITVGATVVVMGVLGLAALSALSSAATIVSAFRK